MDASINLPVLGLVMFMQVILFAMYTAEIRSVRKEPKLWNYYITQRLNGSVNCKTRVQMRSRCFTPDHFELALLVLLTWTFKLDSVLMIWATAGSISAVLLRQGMYNRMLQYLDTAFDQVLIKLLRISTTILYVAALLIKAA